MSQVIDYFRKYIHIPSASDESTGARPSTPGQKQMAQTLEEDMRALGLKDVRNFDNGYVWGRVPANAEGQPVIGLIAHLDVVNNEPCDPMRERVVANYGGDAIEIGSGVTLSPEEFPAMKRWKGKDLIVTDGKTILG
ncbi:MAG: peptidase T, partial [Clostridia bacterium]|nr:peptidase T [Clostridia bacterium]